MDVLSILTEASLNLRLGPLANIDDDDEGSLHRGDGVGTYPHTIHRHAWTAIHPQSNYRPSLRNLPQTSRFNLKSNSDLYTPPPEYI